MKRVPSQLIPLCFVVLAAVLVSTWAVALPVYRVWKEMRDEDADHITFMDTELLAESIRRGDHIIKLLEAEYQASHTYPGSLHDLPDDAASRLPPVAGRAIWRYRTDKSGKDYQLEFGCGEACYPKYYYNAKDREWLRDS